MLEALLAEQGISAEMLARALLRVTNTSAPPTDPDRFANYLGLSVVEVDPAEYGLDQNVRAFLWPSQRRIGIHRTLAPKRRTFSILHEVGHFVLPGHALSPDLTVPADQRGIIADIGKNLSARSDSTLEIEANQFAADCLFQLDSFDERASREQLDWTNIRTIADEYGASFEATARRWVERAPYACALVVFNPVSRRNVGSPLEILYTITSKTFRDRYFHRLTPGQEMGFDTLIYRLFYNLEYQENPAIALRVRTSANKEPDEFHMSLFSNNYRMFGLIDMRDR